MFYSQLYRSIRQVCSGFSRQTSLAILISSPVLISVPTAYGSTVQVSSSVSMNNSQTITNGNTLLNQFNRQKTTYNTQPVSSNSLKNKVKSYNDYNFSDISNTQTKFLNPNNKSANTPINDSSNQSSHLQNNLNTKQVKNSLDKLSEFYKPISQHSFNQQITNYSNTTNLYNQQTYLQYPDDKDVSTFNDRNNIHTKGSVDNLEQLYGYYTGNKLDNDTLETNKHHPDSIKLNNSSINPNQTAPVVLPELFERYPASAQSYRCEGVWVAPSSMGAESKYAEAINKAKQQDGLSTAKGLPLYAQADYAYYDNNSYVELSGDVQIIENNQLINADKIVLDLSNGVAGAKGGVLLADNTPITSNKLISKNAKTSQGSGLITIADELAYKTDTQQATAYDVAFASIPMQAHGYAHKLNKPNDKLIQLDKVMFTTCPPNNRKWQLEAEAIDINSETGRGESYNTTFRLGGVPVLYLPYFNFPIDDRRTTGLLTPSATLSSENGLKVSVPYYLNLAPNYDATLITDIYTNRNPMLTVEYRYLTSNFGHGELISSYLPNDRKYNDDNRAGVFYKHQWTPESLPNLSASAVYNYVSDPQFLNDFDEFDKFNSANSSLNLPRRVQINYLNDYVDSQLKIETFQSLKAVDASGNIVQDKDKPYSRLPQLSIYYKLPFESDFIVTGIHDTAYFKKSINDGSENEKSGLRLYNKLEVSYPIQSTWGYITPKANLQHLFASYDEDSQQVNNISDEDNIQSAFVPQLNLDAGLNFYQTGSPLNLFDNSLGGYQLLSPRLKYIYSSYQEQNKIPNFNTRIASFDYNQLFADSRFMGYDRLADNNSLAMGVNYRYIDAMGVTRFDGSIGDQLFFDDIKVTLNEDDEPITQSSSGLAWNTSTQPYRNVWLDFNGGLTSDNDLNFLSTQIRYQPTPLSLLNLGFIERKEDKKTNQAELSAITASTLFPINNNWRIMAQGQFDNNSNKFIESTIGLDFEDCCYGFSIYARNYYNDLNLDEDPTRAIMAEFRINGIGDSNSRYKRLLSNKIYGFEPIEDLWK